MKRRCSANSLLVVGLAILGGYCLPFTGGPAEADSTALVQRAKLTASDPSELAQLGWSSASSGDTVVAGAPDLFSLAGQGAAYVFVRHGTVWSQQQKLTPDDATAVLFGISVAIDGDTIVVGSFATMGSAARAYVFVRNGANWTPQQKLIVDDPNVVSSFLQFGTQSVAISGDTVLLGCGTSFGGAAYVFVRSGATWSQQAKLTADDAGYGRFYFASSVAIDHDTAVAGDIDLDTPASAYVFQREGANWVQRQKLTDGMPFNRQFGYSVAVSGETIVVGTRNGDAAYVFVSSGAGWVLQQRLADPDTSGRFRRFGASVAIRGDTLVVGADEGYTGTASDIGGFASLFVRAGQTWSQRQLLSPGHPAFDQQFGASVAFDGETVVVAATADNESAGALYVFGPNAPPDCIQAQPTVPVLWPPDDRFAAVSIAGLSDPDGDPITAQIDQILQDEAVKVAGGHEACSDAQGVGTDLAQLRARREGSGDGRVYTIFFTATDGVGGSCQGAVRVCVPHSEGRTCRDGGPVFDSTLCGGS